MEGGGDESAGNVILVSREEERFTVPIEVAKLSNLVVTTLGDQEDDDDDGEDAVEIPLPNVKSPVLEKVIEYCTHYKQVEPMTQITTPLKSSKIEETVQEWYAEFVKVDQRMLFELVTAANFMDIKALLDITCLAVAVLIKGKTAEEIRTIFNIRPDFENEDNKEAANEASEAAASGGREAS